MIDYGFLINIFFHLVKDCQKRYTLVIEKRIFGNLIPHVMVNGVRYELINLGYVICYEMDDIKKILSLDGTYMI